MEIPNLIVHGSWQAAVKITFRESQDVGVSLKAAADHRTQRSFRHQNFLISNSSRWSILTEARLPQWSRSCPGQGFQKFSLPGQWTCLLDRPWRRRTCSWKSQQLEETKTCCLKPFLLRLLLLYLFLRHPSPQYLGPGSMLQFSFCCLCSSLQHNRDDLTGSFPF